MKFIILSGGSGKRLWPLSTHEQPKHLLQVLHYNDCKESMLQRVVRQVSSLVNKEDIVIATTESQFELVSAQVQGIQIISEPEGRDTFPAIGLACSYLFSNSMFDESEIIAVVSADAYVDVAFYEKIIVLSYLVKQQQLEMGLIGIKPSHPTSKFGYMVPRRKKDLIEIERFVEKPDINIAKQLIQEGALWNSGVFIFPLNTLLKLLKDKEIPLNYVEFREHFSKLPKNSFDYEVVEKLTKIVALEYNGEWEDLGTWDVLLKKMNSNVVGNVNLSEDCVDISVLNNLNIPIKLLGVTDLVIVATEDGILITNKDATARLKDIL